MAIWAIWSLETWRQSCESPSQECPPCLWGHWSSDSVSWPHLTPAWWQEELAGTLSPSPHSALPVSSVRSTASSQHQATAGGWLASWTGSLATPDCSACHRPGVSTRRRGQFPIVTLGSTTPCPRAPRTARTPPGRWRWWRTRQSTALPGHKSRLINQQDRYNIHLVAQSMHLPYQRSCHTEKPSYW